MKNIPLFLVFTVLVSPLMTNVLAQRPDPPLPMVSYVGKSSKSREVKGLISWLKQNGYEKESKGHYGYYVRGEGTRDFHLSLNEDKTVKAVMFSEPFLVTEDGLRPDATNSYPDLPSGFDLRVSCDGEKANIDLPGGMMLYSAPSGYYSLDFPEFIVGRQPEPGQTYNHYPAYVEGVDADRYAPPRPVRSLVSMNLGGNNRNFTCISGNCQATSTPERAEVQWPGGYLYQGMFANGAPNGQGKLTYSDPDSPDKVEYEGTFVKGKLIGEFTATQFRNNLLYYQLSGVTDEEGRVIKADGKAMQNGKNLFIEFSTGQNRRLDLSSADPDRIPGSFTLYSSSTGRQRDYDYVIHTTGYLLPLCLHTFKGCDGNFVQSDVEGSGDYRSAVFKNGEAIDYAGPVRLPTLCSDGEE